MTALESPAPGPRPAIGRLPSLRGRPTQARSEEISAHILATATAMFLTDGYDATTIEAIALSAGVPKTTIYKRYRDKQALLRAVIQDRLRDWSEISTLTHGFAAPDLEGRLVQHLTSMLEWVGKPEVRGVNQLVAHLLDFPQHQLPGEDFWGYQQMLAELAEAIRELGPAQGIHPADPARVARALMAMVAGLAFRLSRSEVTREVAEREARFVVRLFITGAAAW